MPSAVFLYGSQRSWSWRHLAVDWRRDARLLWLALIPTGLLIYMGYLWARLGDPLRFLRDERVHWQRVLKPPWVDVWRALEALARHAHQFAAHPANVLHNVTPGQLYQIWIADDILPLAALLLALAAIVIGRRRLPPAYTLYAVLSLALPLFYPSALFPLYSLHRFLLPVFPVFMVGALVLKDRPILRWSLVAVSCLVMVWLCLSFVVGTHAI